MEHALDREKRPVVDIFCSMCDCRDFAWERDICEWWSIHDCLMTVVVILWQLKG